MHQQIRQGDSLIAPFTMPPPSDVSESGRNSQITVPRKPLDFLLPFAVAANMNAGAMVRENLQAIAADLRPTRSPEKTDGSHYLLDFLMTETRLPFASDPIKPWDYQGWLLPYVILAHAARHDVVNRWGWWAACHLRGELTSEPIPRICFQPEFGSGAKDAFKIIDRCLKIIGSGASGSWSAYTDFIEWLAWGCGASAGKPNFNEKTNEELYRAFDLEPFLTRPSDYLGQHLAERKGKGWNPNAFFPTPHTVCEFMAQITYVEASYEDGGAVDRRMLTVSDPALGSGRQLMHASNFSVRLYGTDIDALLVKICLINGALFVPWLSFPFPHEWFRRHDAARLRKPNEKFVLAAEHENKILAAKILEKLKVKFQSEAVD